MRVLHLAPRVPWPLDTGAKLRNYHLGRVLSHHAQVVLLAFTDGNQDLGSLESFYQRVITVPRDPGYTPAKIVRGVLGRTPLPVLNYTNEAMKQSLSLLLDDTNFDLVQVESIHLFSYLPLIQAARNRPLVVCDWHNIESELMRRYSEREASFLKRVYARKTSEQLSAIEKKAMHEFDAHVVVSDRDGKQLRALNREAQIFVIENGVDTNYYNNHSRRITNANQNGSTAAEDKKSRRIVFVGSMDYHANIDAVTSFAHDVWPLCHATHPELIFTIVGRNPSAEVVALSSIRGIEVTGTVDDVRSYYDESIVAIAPLKGGSGSRLKILEAMAAGVPVVSTTLGAEGLDVQHGENILIADTGQELSEAIGRVVENVDLRRQLQDGGRALVHAQYDWLTLGARLIKIYEQLSRKRRTPTHPQTPAASRVIGDAGVDKPDNAKG